MFYAPIGDSRQEIEREDYLVIRPKEGKRHGVPIAADTGARRGPKGTPSWSNDKIRIRDEQEKIVTRLSISKQARETRLEVGSSPTLRLQDQVIRNDAKRK